MQRDSVTSLRPAFGMPRALQDLGGTDPDAAYGCVDWFPYHEATLAACSPQSSRRERAAVIETARQEAVADTVIGARPGG